MIHIVLNIVYHKVMMTVEITCGCGEQGKELNYLEAEIPQISQNLQIVDIQDILQVIFINV